MGITKSFEKRSRVIKIGNTVEAEISVVNKDKIGFRIGMIDASGFITVDWGDGSPVVNLADGIHTHDYSVAGDYTVSFSNVSRLESLYINNDIAPDYRLIDSVKIKGFANLIYIDFVIPGLKYAHFEDLPNLDYLHLKCDTPSQLDYFFMGKIKKDLDSFYLTGYTGARFVYPEEMSYVDFSLGYCPELTEIYVNETQEISLNDACVSVFGNPKLISLNNILDSSYSLAYQDNALLNIPIECSSPSVNFYATIANCNMSTANIDIFLGSLVDSGVADGVVDISGNPGTSGASSTLMSSLTDNGWIVTT